jgi:hypothetical protein
MPTGEHYYNITGSGPVGSVGAECCQCPEERDHVETVLPTCHKRTPRLAEAVLGGKHVYEVPIPSAPPTPEFDPDLPGGFAAGELRPEIDDGKDD